MSNTFKFKNRKVRSRLFVGKTTAASILFFIFCSLSSNANTIIAGADTAFSDFISNFKEIKLPMKLNFIFLAAEKGHKKIEKDIVAKFLCKNTGKDCFWDEKGNTKKYFYLFKYRISDTLIALAYEETIGENNIIVRWAAANIKSKMIVSKLVIAGKSVEQNFEISSEITFAFEIKVKTVNLKERINPNKKEASKFKYHVEELKEEIKVESNGKLKKLKRQIASYNGMIDASNQGMITYPVE